MRKHLPLTLGLLLMFLYILKPAYAMHIMEGFLPPVWCLSWGALAIPFVVVGFFSIRNKVRDNPRLVLLLAMAGAYTFVLSALKLPSVTGSCSHPTGVGLGTILFGPTAMAVIGLIVLLFQALLLAHGGLTTLGANTFAMAVVGPLISYFLYKLLRKLNVSLSISVFASAMLGDLMTYVTTSVELALAFPDQTGGFVASLVKFMSIFAVTQLPLAISEGILTVLIFNAIAANAKDELQYLNILSKEA